MGRILNNKAIWGQYSVIGFLLVALSYFVIHAFVGAGSIQALRSLDVQEAVLVSEALSVETRKETLERRIAMLRDEQIDPDFLETSVRQSLGFIADDEVVLIN